MRLLALGLNHTTAPLAIRERVAFGPEETVETIGRVLSRLSGEESGQIREALILSTCNRTELYCSAEDPDLAIGALEAFLAEEKNLSLSELTPHTYALTDLEVVEHAFSVASGLDSMVLGETQIVGQMKKAEKAARRANGLGLMLNTLFQRTFTVAKEVRTATEIGAHTVSMAAAAVRLANRLFGELHDLNVLFVGAGEMIELCAAHFNGQSPRSMTIANRSLDRGEALAARFSANSMKLADLPQQIANFDIIVSCTASALPIIGLGMIERAIRERHHKPIFIVDLAVPRDVEEEVARLDDVYVYTVDDLGKVVQSGKAERLAAVEESRRIIQNRVLDFSDWLQWRNSVPTIEMMIERASDLSETCIERAKHSIKNGNDVDAALKRMAHDITRKLIHDNLALLKDTQQLSTAEREHLENCFKRFYLERKR
ncbi:MAG TPA: glutamyl-tRNA reductase [Candidatus Aphodousia faecigallinarum]|uniref:Glutamyl-tRNA reductase n=1 Tax=Candidatus Aphodousia faecigallinarum TaxID=2840677 RepID=A0A9D1IHN6_9BURK|nr:glutamyl-tRNA reductase [Candidatus Aphodousia faecigallinarum]